MARKNARDKMRETMRQRIKNASHKKATKGFQAPLRCPEGARIWEPPEKETYRINFFMYPVTTDVHPDGVEQGEEWYTRTFRVHKNLGGSGVDVICPSAHGKPCPACERAVALRKLGWDEHKDEIQAVQGTPWTMYASKLEGEDEWLIFAWNTSKFAKTFNLELDEGELDNLDFAFAVGGKTIKFRVVQENFEGSKYLSTSKVDFEDREDFDESVINTAPKLDDCLVCLPYTRLQELMMGLDDDDGGGDHSGGGDDDDDDSGGCGG